MLVASGLLAGSKVLVPGIARGWWKWKNMIRKGTNSHFGGYHLVLNSPSSYNEGRTVSFTQNNNLF